MFDVFALRIFEDGIVDVVDFHLAWTLVYYAAIVRHAFLRFTTGTIIVFGCVCGKARLRLGSVGSSLPRHCFVLSSYS